MQRILGLYTPTTTHKLFDKTPELPVNTHIRKYGLTSNCNKPVSAVLLLISLGTNAWFRSLASNILQSFFFFITIIFNGKKLKIRIYIPWKKWYNGTRFWSHVVSRYKYWGLQGRRALQTKYEIKAPLRFSNQLYFVSIIQYYRYQTESCA